ncbi:hypothetical protein ACQ9BO_24475 [Flavobacterium sp. P21]|uniref:hypothetical protein n=1 Tax=Flavobacterium sp. P21 TaxID=3423948 RepID=UPI003D66B3B2
MKKSVIMLLLIQSGFVMAQAKIVVTMNGEKVTIHPNADNGLTANEGFIELGGALIKPTTLTTTDVNTLAIKGLQNGGASDNIVVVDANGVLKTFSAEALSSAKGVKIINDNYTIVPSDYTVIASKLSGDITIALPDALANKGRILIINQDDITNDSGNEVTVKFNKDVIYSDNFKINELASTILFCNRRNA